MTQAPVEELPPPPPWLADPVFIQANALFNEYMARLTPVDRNDVFNEVADRVAEDWTLTYETMWDALPLKKIPPRPRLQKYLREWPQQRWDNLKLKWPRDYEELWNDFQRLLVRAENGDWSEEE